MIKKCRRWIFYYYYFSLFLVRHFFISTLMFYFGYFDLNGIFKLNKCCIFLLKEIYPHELRNDLIHVQT